LFIFSVKEGPFYEPYFQCVTYAVSAESERLYNIINFITLFFIPLLGLIASYLSIYCTLSRGRSEMRMMSEMSVSMTHNRQRSMKRAMVKSRWIAVVIVCAYIVFWLPYYGTMLVYFLSPGQWYDSKWMDWIFFFGMANSVVNPAVYGMFQLWKPKRRKQWSCFRPREGSTQLTHLTIQESFRRAKPHKPGLSPLSPTGSLRGSSLSLPPSPVALHTLPDVRREAEAVPSAETSQRTTTTKPANLSWRARVLRKYRTLRAASNQTHI
ncbi:gonadotropin-releasing hormone receptor-like, partial [Frankliniella occidentalis]|uniref:Gonadotropin-releasing hormone receptor-like n=1 Tax=Frankliniella occidentalis TaxID=133901 RepID=A0A9C6X852_FRAOC